MKIFYGWVVVAAGALMGCVAIGTTFSLAVFLQPMSEATGWSRTGISTAMTVVFLSMGIGAFFWGALTDRFGPRPVVLAGAVLLGAGLAISSRATSLLEFTLVYGILVGGSAGSIFAPMMATVTGWFDKHRSIAVSLVSAGMGVAPMTISPFAQSLLQTHDWRGAQLIIAVVAWVLLIPTAFFVRRPPPVAVPAPGAAAAAPASNANMTVGQALSSPQFIVLSATFFACCAMHSGPIFHTISYAVACGLAPAVAVTIYSMEGLAGLFGRLIFGVAGDRFGAKPTLVVGLMIQALAAGAYFFTRQLGEFYAVAIVFGATYSGVMPLYAVIAREYFPLRIMGTVFGAAAMLSSLGMALGPALGGWVFDHFGTYGWLYVGSFAVGIGAAAIALFFPPLPSQTRKLAQPHRHETVAGMKQILLATAALALSSISAFAADPAVERGKYLVNLASCNDCHTPGYFLGKPDMARFLGGSDVGFEIPGLGVFHGPNLTPDKETGLGGWTDAQILAAFQKGVRPDGRMLAPIMPWHAFANLTPQDAQSIVAYLRTIPAVKNKVLGPFGPTEKPTGFVMKIIPPEAK